MGGVHGGDDDVLLLVGFEAAIEVCLTPLDVKDDLIIGEEDVGGHCEGLGEDHVGDPGGVGGKGVSDVGLRDEIVLEEGFRVGGGRIVEDEPDERGVPEAEVDGVDKGGSLSQAGAVIDHPSEQDGAIRMAHPRGGPDAKEAKHVVNVHQGFLHVRNGGSVIAADVGHFKQHKGSIGVGLDYPSDKDRIGHEPHPQTYNKNQGGFPGVTEADPERVLAPRK